MFRKFFYSILASTLFVFSGCSLPFWNNNSTPITMVDTTKMTADKVVLSELDLDRPYTLIQDITVTVSSNIFSFSAPSKEAVAVKLKEEAAKLGAHAVIYVHYKKLENGWSGLGGGMEAKGKAVKFKYY